MSVKSKLELNLLGDQEVIDLGRLIVTSMNANATFPAPDPALKDITTEIDAFGKLLEQRADLLQKAQTLTLQIRATRNQIEGDLNAESIYVDGVVEGLPPEDEAAAIKSAGMGTAAQSGTSIGLLPKVDGLIATQGDLDGGIDLSWNPVKRGLKIYLVELTDDPGGQTGWRFAKNATKSKTAITGLVSGKRYWFRVSAEGAAGTGPASETATKVAP